MGTKRVYELGECYKMTFRKNGIKNIETFDSKDELNYFVRLFRDDNEITEIFIDIIKSARIYTKAELKGENNVKRKTN